MLSRVAPLLPSLPAALAAALLAPATPTQAKYRPPERRNVVVAEFETRGLTGPDALAKLSAQVGVPMGIEWLGKSAGAKITRTWQHESATQIAEQIAREANPKWNYRAAIHHGVLEVRPAKSLRLGHSLADDRLPEFSYQTTTQPFASVQLRYLERCRLLRICPATQVYAAAGGELVSGHVFREASVADILDYLDTAGKSIRVWFLAEDPAHLIRGTRLWRTILWYPQPRPVPEQGQPWWVLARWRQAVDAGGAQVSATWPCPRCWQPPPPQPGHR